MQTINAKFEDTSNKIISLGNKSEVIGNVTGLIDDITFQTNILAINAALEAAHAGETGKGFVVVAQEVNALAESTSKSTKEIRRLIKEIQDDINVIILDIKIRANWLPGGLKCCKKQPILPRKSLPRHKSRRMPQISWQRLQWESIKPQKSLFLQHRDLPIMLRSSINYRTILRQSWVSLN